MGSAARSLGMDGETLRLLRRARDVPAHEADLAALYRDHRPGLVRLAVLLVGDQETAEDVVPNVFTRLHGLACPRAFDVACWVETEDAERCGLS